MSFASINILTIDGFFYLHSPVITGSDAEGAGEMFRVTTLDLNNLPKDENGQIDFKEDFFGKTTNLTVSGQLEGGTYCDGIGKYLHFWSDLSCGEFETRHVTLQSSG
jgi:asparaginyl-tRNA synthetase